MNKHTNRHTFSDAVDNKRDTLTNDLDEDDDDDVDDIRTISREVEGEESASHMGFNDNGDVLEPFNLKDEREGGHFDSNQNYVFQKDKGEIDAWLDTMDETTEEKSIGEAQEAVRKQEERRKKEEEEESKKKKLTPMQLKVELLKIMNKGETVVSTMRRLSGKKQASNNGIKRRGDRSNTNTNNSTCFEVNKYQLDKVTEYSNELLTTGLTGIYEMTYESIEASTVQWEYQALDGTIQGPFTSLQISGWKSQGFFTGSSAVMMRKVGIAGIDYIENEALLRSKLLVRNDLFSTDTNNNNNKRNLNNRDNDELNNTIPGKKVKFHEKEDKKENFENDLMNDFDNDDDEVDVIVSNNTNNTTNNNNIINENVIAQDMNIKGSWISSDMIDFGDYIQLEDVVEGGFDDDDNDNDDNNDN